MGPYCRKSLFLRIEILTNLTGGGDPVCILQVKEACLELFQGNQFHNMMNEDGDEGQRQ